MWCCIPQGSVLGAQRDLCYCDYASHHVMKIELIRRSALLSCDSASSETFWMEYTWSTSFCSPLKKTNRKTAITLRDNRTTWSNGKHLYLYASGIEFKPQPSTLMVPSSPPSKQMPGQYMKSGHHRFPPYRPAFHSILLNKCRY
jgi:hypothetical protein